MTLVIAHRGASHAEQENTIAAFERAVQVGADSVELDVRRTADDRLVVHHDAYLADGRPIRSTRRAELPAHIPELADALDTCVGIAVNIEIKNESGEPDHDSGDWVLWHVVPELARRGSLTRWLISSFRWETVARCRRHQPGLRSAVLTYDAAESTISRAASAGHAAIHPWVDRVDEAAVRRAHAHSGLAVNVWTCDDPDRMRELMAWGVDGICTNVPDIALAIRRR